MGSTVDDDPNIIKMPDVVYEPPPGGFGEALFTSMKANSANVAQVEAETGRTQTYEELLLRCIRTALKLKQKGIKEGDLVCLITRNTLDNCVPYIAAQFLGAVVFSLDYRFSSADMANLLDQVPPKIMFIVPDCLNNVKEALNIIGLTPEIVIMGEKIDECTSFSEFLVPSSEENDFKVLPLKSVFQTSSIFYSSGTTGLAKGICVSHYGLLAQTKTNLPAEDDVDWEYIKHLETRTCLPITLISYSSLHSISSMAIFTFIFYRGFRRLACETFDVQKLFQYIDKYKIMFLFVSPHQCTAICEADIPKNLNFDSITTVATGGNALRAKYFDRLQEIFPKADIIQSYAQTETSGATTVFKGTSKFDRQFIRNKMTSVGRPILGFWYKIVDPETGKILGPNQPGELYVKTKLQMLGYYNRDSSDRFDEGGWLKTGDILYYDENKIFYVVDRLKEVIKWQGYAIQPAALESIIISHPAVKEAVVLGIPSDDGEQPMALVQLRDGVSATTQEIEDYFHSRVVPAHRVSEVKFITDVPLTVTGKVKRRVLLQRVLNNEI